MSEIRDFFPVIDLCGYITGDVGVFASNVAPTGFFECDGTHLWVSHYPGLFSAIGYTYGGNGSSTFAIPDYRGLFLRCSWTQNVYEADTLKSHTHVAGISNRGGTSIAGGAHDNDKENKGYWTVDSTGGAETRPKNIYVLYAIKY